MNEYKMRNELTRKWETEIAKHLIGKTVKTVRYLLPEELESLGWSSSALAIEFTDGSWMHPSTDDEGNGPGALFTSFEGMETIPVCSPIIESEAS